MNKRIISNLSRALIIMLGILTSMSFNLNGQTLICNDNTQLSVALESGTCGIVTRDAFLEESIASNPHMLIINGVTHEEVTAGGVTYFDVKWSDYIGKTVDFKVIDKATTNSCWGSTTVEANVFASPTLPCAYTPQVHEILEVPIAAGSTCVTLDLTAMGIVFDATCGQTPTFTIDGDAKFPCTSDPSGWCTVDCTYDYVLTANTLEVCIDAPAPEKVVCTVKVHAEECVECETWCPGAAKDEKTGLRLTDDELSVAGMRAFLAESCFASVGDIFKNEEVFGDACSGVVRVVKWSAVMDKHGEDVLVDLGTQAFKISPLSLYVDGMGTVPTRVLNTYQAPDPTAMPPIEGGGILILPAATKTLNCGDDAEDYSLTGQPEIVNHHATVTEKKYQCLDIHYIEIVDIIKDAPTVFEDPATGNEIWILADKAVKEQKFIEFCNPKDFADWKKENFDPTNTAKFIGKIDRIINEPATWPSTVTTGPEILTFEELSHYDCNTLIATASNDTIPACGNGIKIIRTWSIVDWCTTELVMHDQIIEISDKDAPNISAKPNPGPRTVDPWVCIAPVSFGNPGFVDDCNPDDLIINVEVTEVTSGVWVDYDGGLPAGNYVVSYVAVDACGNESKPFEVPYHIGDEVKPVPVCKDNLVVSLTGDYSEEGDGALGKVYAEDFDAGSHDGGCGEIAKMEVIRMDHFNGGFDCNPFTETTVTSTTDKLGVVTKTETTTAVFGPHVKFCCGDEGENTVILRVYDAAGNHNDCMVQVLIQNKLQSDIACKDEEIVCTKYTGDPTDFGGFSVGGSDCAPKEYEELEPQVNINSCGIGYIIRTFELSNGQFCRSTITVKGDGAFDPSTIQWPVHYDDNSYTFYNKEPNSDGDCLLTGDSETKSFGTLNCGSDQPICEPVWTGDACGLIGVTSTIDTIDFDQDACYKLIKRWTIVDWCTWEANDGSENLDDENDTDRDTFIGCSDWCISDACSNYYFRYDEVDEDGYYTFDQVIKVVDQEEPEFDSCTATSDGLGEDCTGTINFSATGADGSGCPSETITYAWEVKDADGATVSGGTGTGSSGSVSGLTEGSYTVHYTATDGCGNSGSTECPVDVLDAKAPTPFCLAIATAVMNNGEVEIWASDFIQKASDNCTPEEDLIASFSPDEEVANRILTCDDVTGREHNVRIYVHDASGNADFCIQTFRVDSNGHCDDDNTGGGGDDDDNTGGGDDDGNTGGSDCPDTEGGVLITDPTDLDELTICVGDGISDAFDAKVWENLGDASWLITDADGNILDIPAGPPFDFEGAGEGVCLLWHVSSSGDLTGVEVGANASDIGGCFSLSNPITVTRVTSGDACEAASGNALIAGNISTEAGVAVGEAEVMISTTIMPEYPVRDMTSNRSGNYAFGTNPMDYDYKITPSKNNDYTNGVSTIDLVLIQKHILGLEMLDSPYKLIASDINSDQKITAADLVQLRQLILGNLEVLPNNSSWRFVDASQTFENAFNPWPFAEAIDVEALSHDMHENFIGVKIGDATGNAKANNLVSTEVRSNGKLVLSVANADLAKGDLVSVDVSGDNFSDMFGFQFTMSHPGLELVDIESGSITMTEANVGVRDAMLSMSWNSSEGVTSSDVLFTLNFRTTTEVTLSDALNINSRITTAEAYRSVALDNNDIELVFTDGETTIAASSYDLYQNEPNPFTTNTNVSFVLPQNDSATITVYDVTGKVVRVVSGQYNKGINTINFSKEELGSVSGILYYQLASGEFTATKKMIILE